MIRQRRFSVDSVVLSHTLFALALMIGPQALGLHWQPLARSIIACVVAAISGGVTVASWKTQGKTNYAWTYVLWVLITIFQDFVAAVRASGLADPEWPGGIEARPVTVMIVMASIVAAFVDLVNLWDAWQQRSRKTPIGADGREADP